MPKETYYFQHDYNSRGDLKIIALLKKRGLSGVGAYWCIVEMLYEQNGRLPIEYDDIAYTLKTKKDLIKSVVEDFKLFKNDGITFWSDSVLGRLEKRQEKSIQAKEAIKKRWSKKYDTDTDVLRPINGSNTIKERKGKEIKGEERRGEENDTPAPPKLSDYGEHELIPIDLLATEALEDQINFISHVVNLNRQHNLTPEIIINQMNFFLLELKSNAEQMKNRKDFRSHFKNWLALKLPKLTINKPVY